MAKGPDSDLADLFKQASEIAQQVPEHLQEAAFNKAIDLLTGVQQPEAPSENPNHRPKVSSQRHRTKQPQLVSSSSKQQGVLIDTLLRDIDSTSYPQVFAATSVLERSLWVLQLCHLDHNVDGLSPSDIARILTDKFRVKSTDSAVRMALSRASDLVDRVPQGKSFIYRIMAPGEEHLSRTSSEEQAMPRASKSRSRGRNKSKKKIKTAAAAIRDTASKPATSARRNKQEQGTGKKRASKSRTIGPKAAILALIEAGYLDQGRTGPDVQSHLSKKRGLLFGADQIRTAMLRLVREEILERDENAEGQYEYKKS